MLRRCETTLEDTDHNIRCWWQTYTRTTFYAIPFRKTLRPATRQKYTAHWKQLLCYLFRMWRLRPTEHNDISGLRLCQSNLEHMSSIWSLLGTAIRHDDDHEVADNDDELDQDCPNPLLTDTSELTEQVFAFSISLLTPIYKQGRPNSLCRPRP